VTNLNLYARLGKVLKTMRRDRVPVIALKGAYLAQEVYDSIGLRRMSDVDLLVPKSALRKAADSLEKIGYRPVRDFKVEVETALSLHLPPFKKPDAPPVEIHWTIEKPIYPFRIDVDGLWERARPAAIAGEEILVLSPLDLLLHTCLHAGYHHRFDGSALKAFCDIGEILRRHGDQMDWERFTLRAGQWRVTKSVHLCLYLAREIMGAPAPGELLDALRPDDFDERIAAAGKEKILAPGGSKEKEKLRKLALLFGRGNIWSRAAYLLKNLFPPRGALSRQYAVDPGSWRIYFYYPIRCKDLFVQGAKTAWRVQRGDDEAAVWTKRENTLENYLTPE
ncbi:MAG: nucleotidyltransferase family protein, partial [Desulfobacterales bacterium]|nr:nucleotidyltransferase family protein [Desulfobacterales bacterium]